MAEEDVYLPMLESLVDAIMKDPSVQSFPTVQQWMKELDPSVPASTIIEHFSLLAQHITVSPEILWILMQYELAGTVQQCHPTLAGTVANPNDDPGDTVAWEPAAGHSTTTSTAASSTAASSAAGHSRATSDQLTSAALRRARPRREGWKADKKARRRTNRLYRDVETLTELVQESFESS